MYFRKVNHQYLRIAINIQVLRTPEYIYVIFDMFQKAIAILSYKLS